MRANDPNLPYQRQVAEARGDLSDQVVLVGGAVAFVELRKAVAGTFGLLLKSQDLANVLPGLLAEPERAGLVVQRLKPLSL